MMIDTRGSRPATAAPPPELHLAVSASGSPRPPLSERVEQKFFIPPAALVRAMSLLWRTCRFDPEYPEGRVNSLYFDTPDLDQHERSASGDFAKDKVRIRWYGGDDLDPHRTSLDGSLAPEGRNDVRVWLELKSRRGFSSTKQRLVFHVRPEALAFPALISGIVPSETLVRTMASFGFFAPGPLRPIVTISYDRYRFVEPRTGFRVSLDSHITSTMVVPGAGIGERGLTLPGAVVEVKGARFELPDSLRALSGFGSSWTRYSKYSSSLDGHAEARTSVSRLWPSGLMQDRPGSLGRATRG